VTVTPSTEIETLFGAGTMSEDGDLLSYPKLCAVNGLNIAFASFGVALRVGLTARVAADVYRPFKRQTLEGG
jgi:hypothetical protein